MERRGDLYLLLICLLHSCFFIAYLPLAFHCSFALFCLLPSMFLHIISFDIPYPDNYGGVIVVFNQIKALHAQGVKVLLHCFQYGDREPQTELEKYCHEVHYYPRSRSPFYQLHWLPFIMRTRQNEALVQRLQKDDYPILCEGMHTSILLWDPRLAGRRKLVRMHNVEWQYYQSLVRLTPIVEILKKLYYILESIRLRRIEPKVVQSADAIITLSAHDDAYYRAIKAETYYIPAFHAHDRVESLPGRGEYVLFHGKLSVPDNDWAATWLIEKVFSKMDFPFIVAGMSPAPTLRELVSQYAHIQLIENPDADQMHTLIANAHINLLVSSQVAGIKLKLLNALFQGRFCVANNPMVSGSGLADLCYVRDSPADIQQTIEELMAVAFDQNQIEARRAVLETEFSNQANAQKLMALLRTPEPRSGR